MSSIALYEEAFFDGMQILPRSEKFIDKDLDDDALFLKIAREIKIFVDKLLAQK